MTTAKKQSKAAFIASVIAVSVVIILAACFVIYAFTGSVTQHKILPGYAMSGVVVSYVPEGDAALYEVGMVVSAEKVEHDDHGHEEKGMISHIGEQAASYEEIVASLGVDDATAESLGIGDGCIQLTMFIVNAPDGLIEVKIETGTVRPIDLLFD